MNLKELAASLGLSQTTVSRALNGYPEVNEATRQRVSEEAARQGYSPNASARRLATGHAGAVGIVYTTSEGYGPHTSEFLGGLGARLAEDEIDVLVSTADTLEDELNAYRRAAQSKKVDCIILHSPHPDDVRVELLCSLGLPFVLHGRTDMPGKIAWLDIDNHAVSETAALHLIDHGHRHVALINGPRGFTFAAHREAGFRAALTARGMEPDPRLMTEGLFSDEIGFRLMQALLTQRPRPTAVVAGSMMTALGALRAIRAAGLEVGRDISMIAHDDVFPYLNAETMAPAMSTTRSSIRKAGRRIGELALEVLGGRPPETIQELWPVDLILRQSTGAGPG